MSRPGYSDALRAILEGQPAIARPIIEILEITAADIKVTEADYAGADGGAPGFEIVDGGGVILDGAPGFLYNGLPIVIDPPSGAGLDNRPTKPQLDGNISSCILEWGSGDRSKPIFQLTVGIDNPGGGLAPTSITAQIFRLHQVDNDGQFVDTWDLQPLSAAITIDDPATGSNFFEFVLAEPGDTIIAGDPPTLFDPIDPPIGGIDYTVPITIIIVWGTRAGGLPAGVGVWEADNSFGKRVDPGGTAQAMQSGDLIFGAGGDPRFPYITSAFRLGTQGFRIQGRTFGAATITWTVEPIDLTQPPDPDDELRCTLIANLPAGSSILAEISPQASAVWTPFVDSDVIGVDNTPTGGSDLSGVPRQQFYDIRATLTPSADAALSPALQRIGVVLQTSQLVDGEIDFVSYDVAADPIRCEAEVPTASIRIRRDGVKDYRSFGEELFSDFAFAGLRLAVFIGHPSIARSDWLKVDEFLIRNLDPSGDGLAVDLVGTLFGVLEEFPPPPSRDFDDFFIFDSSLADAWLELHTELDLSASIIGQGPPNTEAVFRQLTEVEPAIDLRQQLDFIAGGVTISRQGVFEFVSLFDSRPPDASLQIPLEDYSVAGWDLGTDRRTTSIQIQFEDSFSANPIEAVYESPEPILLAYGLFGGGEIQLIAGDVPKWFPEDGPGNQILADLIGPRLVNTFGAGLQQVRIKCRTPRPNIEIGDVLNLDQDRLVLFDPFGLSPIRGRSLVLARVVGVHDIFGRDLTLWIQPQFSNRTLFATPAPVSGAQLTKVVVWPGEAFKPTRWPGDFADETGAGGNVGKIIMRWETFGGRLIGTAEDGTQSPRVVLPLRVREHSEIRELFLAAAIDVGQLDVEVVRYPLDGSAPTVLETFTFLNTGGREGQTKPVVPLFVIQADSTYTVEVSCPALADGDSFEIFGFAATLTEIAPL